MPIFNRPQFDLDEALGRKNSYSLFSPRTPPIIPEDFRYSNELSTNDSLAPEVKSFGLNKPQPMEQPEIAQPQASESINPSLEKPKKQSLFSKVGSFFGSEEVPGGKDELGIDKPATHKEGMGSKALRYIIPALFGAVGGVGVLPGLGTAFFNQKNNDARNDSEDQSVYQKQRAAALKAMEPTSYQKDNKAYEGMTEDQRKLADRRSAAGKLIISPLDQQKFKYQQEKDKADRDAKLAEKEQKKGEEQKELEVPGYESTGSVRVRPADAEKLRSSVATLNSLNGSINLMKEYTDKYGTTELTGEGSAKLESLHTSILMELKNLYELGVLNGPDMSILSSQLTDPTSFRAFFTRGGTKKAGLDQLLRDLNSKVDAKMNASGYKKVGSQQSGPSLTNSNTQPNQSTPSHQEAIDWAKANPNDPRSAEILRRNGM